ncbi:MAG: sigma-70 family RNA polymerase sigma factor [Bacilli bacterium]|nr:sigma-70 family RNA polymerase sigma factor [Bacilli bacterium]
MNYKQTPISLSSFDDLATKYKPLVISIVKNYNCKNYSFNDLIAFGLEGLYEASLSYNPELGKLSSYAYPFIENAIKREINSIRNTTYISGNALVDINKLKTIENNLRNKLERNPSIEEIAEAFGTRDISYITMLYNNSRESLSLSDQRDDGMFLEDTIGGDDSPVKNCYNEEDKENIESMCNILDDNEYLIVSMKLGINGYLQSISDKDIAGEVNMTINVMNKIYSEAIKKLRRKYGKD